MAGTIDISALLCKDRCFWCQGPMVDPAKLETLSVPRNLWRKHIRTRDHLIPRKHGGAGFTVPCCWLCNHLKGSMDPMRFRDKHRPHVPVERVMEKLLEAKFAQAKGSRSWIRKKHDAAARGDKLAAGGDQP